MCRPVRIPAARDPADTGRVTNRVGGDVEALKDTLEICLILHNIKHFQERHGLYASKFLGNERVKIIAPLFAIGDDIYAGFILET